MATHDAAVTCADTVPQVKLVANEPSSTASLGAQHDAHFLFYSRDTVGSQMTERQFQVAMAVHLRTLPRHLNDLPRQCNCGHTSTVVCDAIEHCLKCVRSSRYTAATRHNDVRDAIMAIVRSYGVSCSSEPTFYEKCYDSFHDQRPDITFHTCPKIATDLTIVTPHTDVGVAAAEAADNKVKVHKAAVAKLGHVFLPFAMETFGHRDKSCFALVDHLKGSIPQHLHRAFTFAFHHGVSTTLAIARANTIISAFSTSRLR
jgi:hypothetical protein